MKNYVLALTFLLSTAALADRGLAQGEITVPFSDASQPGTVTASLLGGSITVTGYAGETVAVSTGARVNGAGEIPERAQGLRRIGSAGGVNITERNNVITIESNAWFGGPDDFTIRVPRDASLELSTMTGDIRITGVEGEVEVQTMSGNVYLTDLSGPAVVHATNGEVVGASTATSTSASSHDRRRPLGTSGLPELASPHPRPARGVFTPITPYSAERIPKRCSATSTTAGPRFS